MEVYTWNLLWVSYILLATTVMETRSEGIPCTDGSVRLLAGSSEGYVEICREGSWEGLQVCGSSKTWEPQYAAVVCRELGFVPWGASVSLTATNTSGHIVNSYCDGTEPSFDECQTQFEGNCTEPQDAWVSCIEASVCTEGDLRLEGGQNDMEGLVEVCLEGGWGTVCANANWQDIDATVACGQLGFSPNGSTTASFDHILHGGFVVIRVDCSGEEEQLTNCDRDIWVLSTCPGRTGTAGVTCQAFSPPPPSRPSPSPSPLASSSDSQSNIATETGLSPSEIMDRPEPTHTSINKDTTPSPSSPQADSQMPLLAAFLGGCGVLLLCALTVCIASVAILVKARKHRRHVHSSSGDSNAKTSTFHNPVYGAGENTTENGLAAVPGDKSLADELELMNPLYSIPTSPASNHVPYSHIYADRLSTAGIIDTAVDVPAPKGGCGMKEGAYSQLDLAGPSQYATLEPFITGKSEGGNSNEIQPTEGYSHLNHT